MARFGSVKVGKKKFKIKNHKLLESIYKKSHPKTEYMSSPMFAANAYNLMTSEEL